MNQLIHAAVRRDLARTESALRALAPGDSARAADIKRAWDFLWSELRRHHEMEDAHVWPYVRSLGVVEESVVDAMESEHTAMGAACEKATAAIDLVAAEPSTANAAKAAALVDEAARVTGVHLEHEESAITPVVKERVETAEWKAVEKELRKGGPGQAGRFFAWLQDGATPEQLAGLRAIVPGPVTVVLSRVFGRSYHRSIAPVWR